MLVLGLDFETTGLDIKKDRITEVGAVLWDAKTHTPVQVFNELVRGPGQPPQSQEIIELTGITNELLESHGVLPSVVFPQLDRMIQAAEMVVAHNGTEFDKPLWLMELSRLGATPTERLWIDTCMDVPYPKRIQTRKLVHLAAEHGFYNPFAHRAVFDVLTMLKIMSCYPFEEIKRYAESPNVRLRADVSYERREDAKTRGYRWNGEKKWWVKNIKQFQLEEEQRTMPFRVIVLEDGK